MARARHHAILAVALLAAGCESAADDRVPAGYPRDYADTIDRADREARLIIWSAVDSARSSRLIADFRRRHPGIAVTYVEMPAQILDARFREAVAHRRALPDFLWSSAMDLQIRLTNDGYAQAYASPEAAHLPAWANWKNEAWGTTAEPVVLIYNRRLIADAAVPRTHAALAALLERRSHGIGIATYDITRSAVGYLYLAQDAQASGDFWRLAAAMGKATPRLFVRAEDMLHAVAEGQSALGYDVVGSYALGETRRDPRLGLVQFRDYELSMARIALIPAAAPHPAAARLFVDHLLSRGGQALLAAEAMPSVRSDVAGVDGLSADGIPVRAIRVGPGLLVIRDRLTREHFLKRWGAAIRRP